MPHFPKTAVVEQYHKILTSVLSDIFFLPQLPPQSGFSGQGSAQDTEMEADEYSDKDSGQPSTPPAHATMTMQTFPIHGGMDDSEEADDYDLTASEVGQLISKLKDRRTHTEAKDLSGLVQLLV
ncbi:unnamed protein product [Cyclocybe aegerita]|uniref:Uncharacterized protein n=1 Tax=Cyclocybe aegerita TaxID=1973307 RepID=A0A8S0WUU7_CYCAE|nr:unnamed protein product [Cyclocybe aegerita]